MFTNLRVKNHKALKQSDLIELGSINIICGRNNSGKSTLLEGIASESNRCPGRVFSKEDVDNFIAKTQASQGFGNSHNLILRYQELAREAFNSLNIWFLDDEDRFVEFFDKRWHNLFGNYSLNRGLVETRFREFFKVSPSTILLPPKRNLDLEIKVNNTQGLLPTGVGVTNFLFHAKNQDEKSSENKLYRSVSDAFIQITSGYKFELFMRDNNVIEAG